MWASSSFRKKSPMCEVGVNPNMPQQVVNGHAGGAITAEVYRLHSFAMLVSLLGEERGSTYLLVSSQEENATVPMP